MSSAAPAVGAPAPLDLRLLKRLFKEAMHMCGMDAVQDAVAMHMDAVAGHLLSRSGQVNLAEIWRALSGDPELSPRAGEVLLLAVLYLEQSRGVQAAVPEEAQGAMEAARGRIDDLPGRLFQLSGLVQLSSGAPQPAMPSPQQARREPEPAAGQRAGRSALLLRVAVVAAGLVLSGGLTMFLTLAAAQDGDHDKQLAVVDPATLSDIVQVQVARISPRTLVVVLRDGDFASRPKDEQLAVGKKLLRRVGRQGLEQVYIVSGKSRVVIDPQGPQGPGRVIVTEAPAQ